MTRFTTIQRAREELRLCLLAPGEIFGGAERQMLVLAEWLRDQGIHPLTVLFHDATLAQELRKLNVRVHILPAGARFDRTAVRDLRAVLTENRINLLHYHGYRASVHAYFALRGLNIRILRIKHGLLDPRLRNPMSVLRALLYGACDVLVTRCLATRIIYVSEDLRRHLRWSYFGMPHDVIYNGIGTPLGVPTTRPVEFRDNCFHAVIIARIEAVKGIEFAIRAIADLRTPTNVLLHVVGEGSQVEPLQALARTLGVHDRVAFYGFRHNVQDYLAHADVSLLPSLHEGLPYSLLETLAMGIPVVASNVGGLREVLEHERTALLVPARDAGALAVAIRRLWENPELRAALAREGAAVVAERFSAEAMGRAYVAVYVKELQHLPNRADDASRPGAIGAQ